ncbi:dihydroneopterin aldolase [Verticiella sediminum]|uniref:7,8-dihydroneopterin aldolase n=1 Tax=Verticiella sediminum TaxID=1247510 RepID=A0A556AG83_9BURK|nr:dihydroneopterin aldolase [Verticiella sediminum]TSH91897.1 dihydroneopterin aldolase [Verticiella sediminum]
MQNRRIFFSRLAVDSRIGILDHERGTTQPLHVDAELDVAVKPPSGHDDIHDVLDYRRLREAIIDECSRAHVNLLETLVDRLAARLLRDFADVQRVRLRIGKPMAFADCAAVGIETTIERSA